MKPKIILVSHNFNPGHYSHLIASKKLFGELGYKVNSRVHSKFNSTNNFNLNLKPITFYECIISSKNDVYLVWFPSIKSLFEVFMLRIFSKINTVYIYHEPYESITKFLGSGYTFNESIIIQLKLFISFLIAVLSKKVVMPSKKAFNAVKKSNPEKFFQINLIFDRRINIAKQERKYFSYIGTIAEDHGFYEFVLFIKKYCELNPNPEIKFLIASKNKLDSKYQILLKNPIIKKFVDVRCGRAFSDEEIDNFFSQTIVTWNAYKRSMQSGVLATSYMNGTPVIISSQNRSEFFCNKLNGIEISSTYDFNEILLAFKNIQENFEKFSINCKNSFHDYYWYKSSKKDFLKLLNIE